MQAKKLTKYHRLLSTWLYQYHRTHLEYVDVLHKLQYLKDKLAEYNRKPKASVSEANIKDHIKPQVAKVA